MQSARAVVAFLSRCICVCSVLALVLMAVCVDGKVK